MELRLGTRRYVALFELADHVASVTHLAPNRRRGRLPLHLDKLRLRGPLASGRRAQVAFSPEGREPSVLLDVEVEGALVVRITAETLGTKLKKKLGLVREVEIGNREFDARFLVEASNRLEVAEALRRPVRREIGRLFDLGVDEVRLEAGRLTARAAQLRVAPVDYPDVLLRLDHIARLLDRKSLRVNVLEGDRVAAVDEHGTTRCPYCHEDVRGDELDLVACKKCATTVHDECWKENAGCPTLGCGGRLAERPRARKRPQASRKRRKTS